MSKKIILSILIISQQSAPLIYSDTHTIYAPGIVDGPRQVKRFEQIVATNKNHTHPVSFYDTQPETWSGINRVISEISTQLGKPVNRSKMCMGQTKDCTSLQKTINTLPPEDQIVLVGVSRGSGTILTCLGQQHSENITALVLDACPTSMPQTIHNYLAQLGVPFSWDKIIFSTVFPAYPTKDLTPLAAISKIKDKKMPILLVHSKTDKRIPFAHSLMLYREFIKQGFTNVYLVAIPHGKHSFLLQDDTVKNIYLTAVHSFYKKFNLPYNEQYAQDDLSAYQHDLEIVEQQIKAYKKELKQQLAYSKTRNKWTAGISLLLLTSWLICKKSN